MKTILKIAFVFCLFACGVTACAAAPVQPSAGQTTETKKMGKKRRGKKLPQAQKMQKNKIKKKKGSKGFLRTVANFGGALIGAAIGTPIGVFIGVVVGYGVFTCIVFLGLASVDIVPALGFMLGLTGYSVGGWCGLGLGAYAGWSIIDTALDRSEDSAQAVVSLQV